MQLNQGQSLREGERGRGGEGEENGEGERGHNEEDKDMVEKVSWQPVLWM